MRSARTKRHQGRIVAAVALILALSLGLSVTFWLISCQERAHPRPSLGMSVEDRGDGLPLVDWEYWMNINPDIIGWVTIPQTRIDLPVVQASQEAPRYYLDHDIYGEPNPLGCPYVDAECEGVGFEARNTVVFGHHWSTGEMFADLANYSDEAFAEAHELIYLQTPESAWLLQVEGAAIIRGSDRTKRLTFEDESDYDRWYEDRMSECCVRLSSSESPPSHLVTFVTCSYQRWQADERTAVYARRESCLARA